MPGQLCLQGAWGSPPTHDTSGAAGPSWTSAPQGPRRSANQTQLGSVLTARTWTFLSRTSSLEPVGITPTCFLWLLGPGLLLLMGLLIPKCRVNVSPVACVLPVPGPQLPAPPRSAFQPRVWRPLTSPGTCSPSGAGTPAFKVSSAVWGWARAQNADPGAPCSPFWGRATTSIFPLQGSSPSHSSQTQERPNTAFSRCRDPEGPRVGQATSAGKGRGLGGHGDPGVHPEARPAAGGPTRHSLWLEASSLRVPALGLCSCNASGPRTCPAPGLCSQRRRGM